MTNKQILIKTAGKMSNKIRTFVIPITTGAGATIGGGLGTGLGLFSGLVARRNEADPAKRKRILAKHILGGLLIGTGAGAGGGYHYTNKKFKNWDNKSPFEKTIFFLNKF